MFGMWVWREQLEATGAVELDIAVVNIVVLAVVLAVVVAGIHKPPVAVPFRILPLSEAL